MILFARKRAKIKLTFAANDASCAANVASV
jgi:hypothetical protein